MRGLILLALLLSAQVFAKQAANGVSADMAMSRAALAPPAPTYPVSISDFQTYYGGIKKTRPLNEQEDTNFNLASVAQVLKVQHVTSNSKEVAQTTTHSLSNAILTKIKEHPKWDVALSAADVKAITPHLELLKKTFGEKSYAWAWFLKQTGKTAEAKTLLSTLFDERCAEIMQLSGTYNRQSPIGPVVEVEQALLPMSNEAEKTKLQKKMQDVKVHVSNLKDYSIMT